MAVVNSHALHEPEQRELPHGRDPAIAAGPPSAAARAHCSAIVAHPVVLPDLPLAVALVFDLKLFVGGLARRTGLRLQPRLHGQRTVEAPAAGQVEVLEG